MTHRIRNVPDQWYLFVGSEVWLTFDDGPAPGTTSRIHDVLDEHDVQALFFVCGAYVLRWPDIVSQTVERGHLVGNHSWSHPCLPRLSKERIHQELVETGDVLFDVTGRRCQLFRPPYGALSDVVHEVADQLGLTIMLWSVSSGDWLCPGSDAIVERVATRVKAGSVVLFHDGCGDLLRPRKEALEHHSSRDQTADAIGEIIRRVRSTGLRFPRLRR